MNAETSCPVLSCATRFCIPENEERKNVTNKKVEKRFIIMVLGDSIYKVKGKPAIPLPYTAHKEIENGSNDAN